MSDDPIDLLATMNTRPADAGSESASKSLSIGSDIEIMRRVKEDLERDYGEIAFTEGSFWHYAETEWAKIDDSDLRLTIHAYDGARFQTACGKPSRVKLNKSRIDSIAHELGILLLRSDFFFNPPVGINCASGFISFMSGSIPTLEPHHPDYRCRHTLPGRWHPGDSERPPPDSLLARLLSGAFLGDEDADQKTMVLAEAAGAAALGYATRIAKPKAIILKGERAENGKSQILDLLRGLLPSNATSAITAAKVGNDRFIVGLIGKLLNACDELSSANAIASDVFKSVITGEPVSGRDVYRSAVEFRPIAQHVFATNSMPAFLGGIDRGVQRRLMVVTFNRVIPEVERIEAIGRRIAAEEPDYLLAWSVAGASRVIRQRSFTNPGSSKQALNDWLYGADPVLAWLNAGELAKLLSPTRDIRTSRAHESFRQWAADEGFNERTLPAINGFTQRINANTTEVEYKRRKDGGYFVDASQLV